MTNPYLENSIAIECDDCLSDATVMVKYLGTYYYFCGNHVPKYGVSISLIPNGKREKVTS